MADAGDGGCDVVPRKVVARAKLVPAKAGTKRARVLCGGHGAVRLLPALRDYAGDGAAEF